MHAYINTAIKAARNAGDIMVRALDRLGQVNIHSKGRNDFVTDVDLAAEREIIDVLKYAYPDHDILSEEAGETNNDSFHQWIIDPIDGTANYMRGLPHFCVSIAHAYKGVVEQGVIYDPIRQDLFTAHKGHGATLNDKKIRVSKEVLLENAIFATGYPYERSEAEIEQFAKQLQTMLPQVSDLRRPGSAALDLAYVACGRLDGYWECDIQVWDMAAGSLMVKEAGGLVSDLNGGEGYLQKGHIMAANPKLYKAAMKTLGPVFAKHWQ